MANITESALEQPAALSHETEQPGNTNLSESDEEHTSQDNEVSEEATAAATSTEKPTNKSRRLAKRAAKAAAAAEKQGTQKHKQRRELDVLNRLRWDDRFNPEEIVIGYEDRHSERGIIEIAFQDWERELTADEFIPLHRIRYFSRNGEFLWHRTMRIDKVFGQG